MLLFPIILALAFISGFFLPWWFVAIISFVPALFIKTTGKPFWIGFAGVGLAWLALALLKTLPNDNILAARVAALFHLPGWIYILALTVLIGGLVGGSAALSGALVKKAITPQTPEGGAKNHQV
ncbi:MAG: hypothetical protein ABIN95_07815 [Mucilaginibacter sp.]